MGTGFPGKGLENDGERKRREKEGLDSRGGPENDGGEKMRDMLTALPVRHSHRRWESRLVLSIRNWIPEQGSRMTEGREADDGGG